MIHVGEPSLAPLPRVTEILEEAWRSGILTHNGPLVQRLERELCAKLSSAGFVAVSSGTIAIQMALKALGLSGSGGEVITTPFTWVATLSAIQWEGCRPVFADVDADTFNIDPARIEERITDRTVAILPVHVFGNPCDVEAIEEIAGRHGLKVIYDAAHAIGSTFAGRCLLDFGDISATSLHATKLFNTAEGGGCIARDPDLHAKLQRIRFFGHDERKEVVEQGFNGKMTEVHAAVGLANLEYFDEVLADRKRRNRSYRELLGGEPRLDFQELRHGEANCSYFPVLLPGTSELLAASRALQAEGIVPRRYFHPSANTLRAIVPDAPVMPVSEDIAARVLCLPCNWKMQDADMERTAEILRGSLA